MQLITACVFRFSITTMMVIVHQCRHAADHVQVGTVQIADMIEARVADPAGVTVMDARKHSAHARFRAHCSAAAMMSVICAVNAELISSKQPARMAAA
jgi:hypothetical protein